MAAPQASQDTATPPRTRECTLRGVRNAVVPLNTSRGEGGFVAGQVSADVAPGAGWFSAVGAVGVLLEAGSCSSPLTTRYLGALFGALAVVGAAVGSDLYDGAVGSAARAQQAVLGVAVAVAAFEAGALPSHLPVSTTSHQPRRDGPGARGDVASTSELLMPPSKPRPQGLVDWVRLVVSSQGIVKSVDGDASLLASSVVGADLEQLLGGAVTHEDLESLQPWHRLPRVMRITTSTGESVSVETTLSYVQGGSSRKLSDVQVALRRVSEYQRAVEARGRHALLRYMEPAMNQLFDNLLAEAEAVELSVQQIESLSVHLDLARGVMADVVSFVDLEMGKMPGLARQTFTIAGVVQRVKLGCASLCAPDVRLEADVEKIKRVKKGNSHCLQLLLTHLVANAAKFTRRGKIVIRAREILSTESFTEGAEDSGGMTTLRFDVIDNGPGIDNTLLHVLRDAFPAEKSMLARPFNMRGASLGPDLAVDAAAVIALAQAEGLERAGAGLGFGTCALLAHLLDGTLEVTRNDASEGAIVTLTVRLEQGEVSEDLTPMPTPSYNRRRLERRSVLVVDDALVNRKVAERLLTGAGYEVVVAEHGEHALRVYNQRVRAGQSFNVILMDVEMPTMNGWQATEALRAQGCTVPVIALTGYTSNEYKVKCMWCGMDAFAAKPFRKPNLLETVARFSTVQHTSSSEQQPFVPFRTVESTQEPEPVARKPANEGSVRLAMSSLSEEK